MPANGREDERGHALWVRLRVDVGAVRDEELERRQIAKRRGKVRRARAEEVRDHEDKLRQLADRSQAGVEAHQPDHRLEEALHLG